MAGGWNVAVRVAITLALASFPAAARAEVLVVDADGSADFTTLQAAIDAARDGDLILVRHGDYGAAKIVGKGLHLAVLGDDVVTSGDVELRNLAPGQTVLLSGLPATRPGGLGPRLIIDGCAGSVRIHGCRIDPSLQPLGSVMARVSNSPDVLFAESSIRADDRQVALEADDAAIGGPLDGAVVGGGEVGHRGSCSVRGSIGVAVRAR